MALELSCALRTQIFRLEITCMDFIVSEVVYVII